MSEQDQITIPEDLSTLSDSDLAALHDTAVTAFQAMLPEDGSAPDDDTLTALDTLAGGIEALKGEVGKRDQAALSRSSKAKELADRVLSAGEVAVEVQSEEDEDEDAEEEVPAEVEDEALVAAGKRAPININLAGLRKGRPAKKEAPVGDTPKTVGLAAQGAAGYDVGTPMSIGDMAQSVNSRLGGFNASAYMNAAKKGLRQSERFTIARLPRQFDERAVVRDEDPRSAMAFAADETNLQGGSLVASGGWCSPSETLYDLAADLSDDADLISVPEIQITRGGIRHTLGPDYRTVFEDTGFCFTEAEDIAGDYDGAGGGTKPCQTVPCPDFEDVRLGYCGVCIGAGLLQQRGYPEVIEDYISKTLNAHAHRVSASVINNMVADSAAITFAASQVGAVAPLLTAIDLQATHYRAVNRMARNATLEVVLPTWVDTVIRADLARRLGVDLISVPDARINSWFAERQVNVQYVVDWQDIATTAASGFTAPPSEVDFLLYAAGTFVKGVTDSITLENIYDSVLLGTNDYTALFTEDPYLVAKRNHDSRVVTVPVSPTGHTAGGINIDPDGSVGA
jgi:hypothetical protein